MNYGSNTLIVCLWLAVCVCQSAQSAVLWQTNSQGNDIHLYDTDTLQQSGTIAVGSNPHGIASDSAQRIVYVALEKDGEANGELLWINPTTHEIEHRLTVGPEPHQLAVSPDGLWAYVPSRDGQYWVIDIALRKVVKKIAVSGRPHNTQISSDGRFAYLSPMGRAARVSIVSILDGHKVVGDIEFSASVRPPALTADGNRLFQHVDGLNGFEVADTKTRKILARVEHSTELGWFLLRPKLLGWLSLDGMSRCHGLALSPDQNELWSVCGNFLAIHNASPPYEEREVISLPAKGYWLSFHPNGSRAFIALAYEDAVAVMDVESRELVKTLSSGRVPKRNLVLR